MCFLNGVHEPINSISTDPSVNHGKLSIRDHRISLRNNESMSLVQFLSVYFSNGIGPFLEPWKYLWTGFGTSEATRRNFSLLRLYRSCVSYVRTLEIKFG